MNAKKKYDRQVILTLISQDNPLILALVEKWKLTQSGPCDVIQLNSDEGFNAAELPSKDKEKMAQLTGNSRLYIYGHSADGLPAITDDSSKKIITSKGIAKLISTTVNHENIAGLRISLLSCRGTESFSKEEDVSLAGTLHRFLKESGIVDIELVAREDLLAVVGNPINGEVRKFSLGEAEKLGTEILEWKTNKLKEELATAADSIHEKILDCYEDNPLSQNFVNLMGFFTSTLAKSILKKRYNASFDQITSMNKLLNRSRSNAKSLYLWQDGRQIKVNAYNTYRIQETPKM